MLPVASKPGKIADEANVSSKACSLGVGCSAKESAERKEDTMGFWVSSECPKCGADIDTRLYGLSSGLGPPTIRCGKCGQLIETRRRELSQMGPLGWLWLLLSSAIFAVGGGMLGGMSMAITRSFWVPGNWPDKLDFSKFFQDILIWGGAMLAIQIYRGICSLLRKPGEPFPGTYWNLQLDIQGKVCVLLIVIPVISLLLSFVFGP